MYPRGMAADATESWAQLLDFVADHGASLEASALVEDFINRHADACATRIEEQALIDHVFAVLVAQAHLGDMSGPGVVRVRRLQDRLFERGDPEIGSRWQGLSPLDPGQVPPDDS